MARRLRPRHLAVSTALILLCADRNLESDSLKGQVDGIRFSVPQKYGSLLYEGEDDWHPRLKPLIDRTWSDPIGAISFFMNLDQLGKPQDQNPALAGFGWPDAASGRQFGPWIPVNALADAFHNRAMIFDMARTPAIDTVFIRNPKILADAYGLHARSSDPRDREYNAAWDTAYWRLDPDVSIVCSRQKMKVAPFSDMSRCNSYFLDVASHLYVEVSFERSDLPLWATVRQSTLAILATFRTAGKAAEDASVGSKERRKLQ